ncbi:hypothetical protein IWW50_005349, partial [Coemansia erecta]
QALDEVGVDIDSLFARMLGFTEDLAEPPAAANRGGGKAKDEGARCGPKTRKSATGEYGRAGGARRKKTRAGSAAALFDVAELDAESAGAAEAICSALAGGSSAVPGAARHAAGARPRKKAVAASGSVRRRRARLHHRAPTGAAGTADLAGPMQSLDLEQ